MNVDQDIVRIAARNVHERLGKYWAELDFVVRRVAVIGVIVDVAKNVDSSGGPTCASIESEYYDSVCSQIQARYGMRVAS